MGGIQMQTKQKLKLKQFCYTPWRRVGEEELLLILDLGDGVSGQHHAPAAL
jgi:hypothetical protein